MSDVDATNVEYSGRPTKRWGARCHHCGAAIDTSEWYPVVNCTDERGEVELYPFCGKPCRATWLAENAPR